MEDRRQVFDWQPVIQKHSLKAVFSKLSRPKFSILLLLNMLLKGKYAKLGRE